MGYTNNIIISLRCKHPSQKYFKKIKIENALQHKAQILSAIHNRLLNFKISTPVKARKLRFDFDDKAQTMKMKFEFQTGNPFKRNRG